MEEAAKVIKSLADRILPKQPFYLSLSNTEKYPINPAEQKFDELAIKPLQYHTLVDGVADRGVLFARAYFDVREEPNSSNAPTPPTLKIDPNKPRKKVSLKDYKNKKVEGDSPPKIEDKEREKSNGLPTIKEKDEGRKRVESAPKEMDSRRGVKKAVVNTKSEAARQRSPSPERRKRVAEVDEGPKPTKRVKVEDTTSNGATRLPKDMASQKPQRSIPSGKNESKDIKTPLITNGRPASSNSALRAGSPKQTLQSNGHGKSSGGQATHKRAISNGEPVSKAVPRLLSPLHIADLSVDKSSDTFLKENALEVRPSPKKRPVETNSLRLPPKKSRDDRDLSPAAKKRKVLPPLLSPTLPAIVMEELARLEKKSGTPSKEASQKNGPASDSSAAIKKPTKSAREETIRVENKKEEPPQYLVTMKYRKRHAKTIERLLNLPSGGKKKAESLKRDDQTLRETSGSVEPGTARKRPRTTADASEALKRPKTSDTLKPSTPPKQSTAMSRIASNSSQVGTPGAANSLTPSAQLTGEKRREPIPQDKLARALRLHGAHRHFMELGTKLKHERDAIMKSKAGVQEREHQTAVAAGIQSLLLYMYAVKLQSDAFDLEKLPRRQQSWREVLPLFRVVRSDCSRNNQLVALLLRIQGICVNYMGRALWFLSNEADVVEKVLATSKEEAEIWRSADSARRKLGVQGGGLDSSDGGVVGKLIDRLGPWTSPEEAIPITLEVMRSVIHIDPQWKPNDELANISRSIVNGANGG